MDIPVDFRVYLENVRESNERIIETKRRQLDPDLREDDAPWLFAESDQVGLHLKTYAEAFSHPSASEEMHEQAEYLKTLTDRLQIEQKNYKTWDEVLEAEAKMNSEIDKVLKGG